MLNQTLREFEFLIYDDGSDEDTKRFLKELAGKDSRIRILTGDQNRGIAYGLNQCISKAKGEYLARMDGDDVCLPERFGKQAAFLDAHPSYDFAGCNAFVTDGCQIKGKMLVPERPKGQDFLRYSPYIHPTVMFRRSVFEKYGTYRSDSSMLRCEDYELFMRLYISGCAGYNLQQELFLYREDKNSYKKRKFRYRMDEARLRRRTFPALGIKGAKGSFFVCRPLLVGLAPGWLYRLARKQKCRNQNGGCGRRTEAA